MELFYSAVLSLIDLEYLDERLADKPSAPDLDGVALGPPSLMEDNVHHQVLVGTS